MNKPFDGQVVVADVGRLLDSESVFPSTAALAQTVADLTSMRGEAIGVRCDITKPHELELVVNATTDAFGEIDVWINNAGIAINWDSYGGRNDDDLDLTINVNVKGTFQAMQAAARYFIARGKGGRIINTASQAGKTGWPILSAYSASKCNGRDDPIRSGRAGEAPDHRERRVSGCRRHRASCRFPRSSRRPTGRVGRTSGCGPARQDPTRTT